jgi:hypothetical protein
MAPTTSVLITIFLIARLLMIPLYHNGREPALTRFTAAADRLARCGDPDVSIRAGDRNARPRARS